MQHLIQQIKSWFERARLSAPPMSARAVRAAAIGLAAVVAGVVIVFGGNVAEAGRLASDPLRSPVRPALKVKLNCGRRINPNCAPAAISHGSARVTSQFYIDGVARGPANRVYLRVCHKFNLSDGAHSARVYAEDNKGNSADTGTIENAIRCRR